MAEFPALPLWTDAYLGDTAHLSNLEHGIYLRILILIWRQPMRRIPKDENWLSRHLSLKDNELLVCRGIAEEYLTGICEDDAEWWTQARLRREWDYVKARSEKQKARAEKRWALINKKNNPSRGNAEPHITGNAPTPTPTPTPTKEISKEISAQRLIVDNEFNLTFWPAYPVKAGKREAFIAFQKARTKVSLETIMAGLTRYCALLKTPNAPQAKYAQGWLNGERWTDETVPHVNGSNGHDRKAASDPRAYGFSQPVPERRTPKTPPPACD